MMDKLVSGASKLGHDLNPFQIQQFEAYYRAIVEGNRTANLTAITNYDDVQVKHFLDSLTVTLAMGQLAAHRRLDILDVGSGAGLPGIPLKILLPNIGLTLLEATARKAVFLERVAAHIGLDDVKVVNRRAEEAAHLPSFREHFDIVVSRAVASMPTLVELTLPFCRTGGLLIAQKQVRAKAEIAAAHRAVDVLGGQLSRVIDVDLPDFPVGRCLVVYAKVSGTPPEYPRRPGMPAKRPLR